MTLRHTAIASGQTSHKSKTCMQAKTKIRLIAVSNPKFKTTKSPSNFGRREGLTQLIRSDQIMAQPKPTRKYEVSYQAKGRNKPVMNEMVEAQSESHVRCLIRASEGMVRFLEIKLCEECAA